MARPLPEPRLLERVCLEYLESEDIEDADEPKELDSLVATHTVDALHEPKGLDSLVASHTVDALHDPIESLR